MFYCEKNVHVRSKAKVETKSCYIVERTLKVNFSFGGKVKVLKSFCFMEKQKIVPLLQNFFQGKPSVLCYNKLKKKLQRLLWHIF